MSLINDIKLMESTGGLGGPITEVEIVDNVIHNLFDRIEGLEGLEGDIEYRCFYLTNTHPSITYEDAVIYLSDQTDQVTTSVGIGLGTSIIGGTEQTIPDEGTTPSGVTFVEAIDESGILGVGDIPAGSHKAIWLRRTVQAGNPATNLDGCVIGTQGVSSGSD